jgi:hypothetical protein
MKLPKQGSKWDGGGGIIFRVLHTVEVEGYTWVHYIKNNVTEDENREYSCYVESFLERFREILV